MQAADGEGVIQRPQDDGEVAEQRVGEARDGEGLVQEDLRGGRQNLHQNVSESPSADGVEKLLYPAYGGELVLGKQLQRDLHLHGG